MCILHPIQKVGYTLCARAYKAIHVYLVKHIDKYIHVNCICISSSTNAHVYTIHNRRLLTFLSLNKLCEVILPLFSFRVVIPDMVYEWFRGTVVLLTDGTLVNYTTVRRFMLEQVRFIYSLEVTCPTSVHLSRMFPHMWVNVPCSRNEKNCLRCR